MNLMKGDWDHIEELIKNALNSRLRTYGSFKYIIIDANHLLVKVYEDKQLIFTIKFWIHGEKLEVSEVY
jgi:hypothetical protein